MSKTLSDKNLDTIFSKFFALDIKFEKEFRSLKNQHLKLMKELINEYNLEKIIKEEYKFAKSQVIDDQSCYAHEMVEDNDVYGFIFHWLHGIQESDGNNEIRNLYQDLYA